MNKQDLTLLTDLYELTMMQGYYKKGQHETVVFDVFYRHNPCGNGYSVCAGLDQVIDYIKNLNFTYEDVDYLRSLHIFDDDFLQYLSGFHFTFRLYGKYSHQSVDTRKRERFCPSAESIHRL